MMGGKLGATIFRAALALGLVTGANAARAQDVPPGYPAAYAQTIKGAQAEGKVVVYATTDTAAADPLLKDFKELYPFLTVEYNDLNSTELYNRFLAEAAAGSGTGDVLWSSSMDLQMKLVADGHSLVYESPETKALPAWAVDRGLAFGTTLEPLVFIYNKRLLPADAVPKSHADLLRLVKEKPDVFKGKVTLYDAEKSGVGFMLVMQDVVQWPAFWDLMAAFGKAGGKYYTSAGAMAEKVGSGEHLLAINIFGSYALLRQQKITDLGIVYPDDYMLGMSRVAFIAKAAKHPNAAKLFLDYLLSHRGQNLIANKSLLYSIRADVTGEATAAALNTRFGDKLKPIPVSTKLTEFLVAKKRLEMLRRWKETARGS